MMFVTRFLRTMQHPNVASMRVSYNSGELIESSVSKNPFEQFELWFSDAQKHLTPPQYEVNAMCLSTASLSGFPSSRMVLLKDYDAKGFVFYTNYNSRKASELESNPNASLLFYWHQADQGLSCKIYQLSLS